MVLNLSIPSSGFQGASAAIMPRLPAGVGRAFQMVSSGNAHARHPRYCGNDSDARLFPLLWAAAPLRRKNWLSDGAICYKDRSNAFDGSGDSSPETVFFCVHAGGSPGDAG